MSFPIRLSLEDIEELKRIKSEKENKSKRIVSSSKTSRSSILDTNLKKSPVYKASEYKKELIALNESLFNTLKGDIINFLENQTELMLNEMDFQMQLSLHLLLTNHYEDVNVEYYLPTKNTHLLEGYNWNSNMRVDIVVSREGEFIPIELKYPTKSVTRDVSRYGVIINDFPVLRNQGAQDLVKYNFWKDVRRVELLKKIFPSVKYGLAILLTNDLNYLKETRSEAACSGFSTSGKYSVGGEMKWKEEVALKTSHPDFYLEGQYQIKWNPLTIDNETFQYTVVEV